MGKKDREQEYQQWLADVKMFHAWHPLTVRPHDARLRELYSHGYGSQQAARQLQVDDQSKKQGYQ